MEAELSGNKYLATEQHIKAQIDKGLFHPDDRLPSIRQLSEQLGVSKNTVIRAYQELEATGWVYSVPKSGYRVKDTEHHQLGYTKPTSKSGPLICHQIGTLSPERPPETVGRFCAPEHKQPCDS